jgi:citronellyl-CoA dehydrogenase
MCLLANTGDGPMHRNTSLICVPTRANGVMIARKLDTACARPIRRRSSSRTCARRSAPEFGKQGEGFTYQLRLLLVLRVLRGAAGLFATARLIRHTLTSAGLGRAFGRAIP